jgi:hypothetical protein
MPGGVLKEHVELRPHPGGARGAMLSLDEVAKRMWASRNDPRVRAWATGRLSECGSPSDIRNQAQCLTDAYRRKVPYVPDPHKSEFMASPVQTLCLDDHGLCIVGGDCDDAAITVGALCLSVGIPVQVVGASYRAPVDVPTHVYLQVQDELGKWLPVDPTTKFEVGTVGEPARVWNVDPDKGVGAAGLAGGDFVGVSKPGRRDMYIDEWDEWGLARPVQGLGFVTPGDVLAYRTAWNEYVLDTVRVADECAAAYASLAAQKAQTDPQTSAQLAAIGTNIATASSDLLTQWNIWANTSDSTIVLQAATILQQQQDTILSAGTVRNMVSTGTLTCQPTFVDSNGNVVTWIAGVDPNVQAQIIARIEGLGILASGTLQILIGATGEALKEVGSAAQWLGQQGKQTIAWITSPVTWLLVGGLAAFAIYNADKIAKVLRIP